MATSLPRQRQPANAPRRSNLSEQAVLSADASEPGLLSQVANVDRRPAGPLGAGSAGMSSLRSVRLSCAALRASGRSAPSPLSVLASGCGRGGRGPSPGPLLPPPPARAAGFPPGSISPPGTVLRRPAPLAAATLRRPASLPLCGGVLLTTCCQ